MTAPADNFPFDHARALATGKLAPEHSDEFARLVRTLRHGSRFQLLLLDCNDANYQAQLIARIDDVLREIGLRTAKLELAELADIGALEAKLRTFRSERTAIHVFGGDLWFDVARLNALNVHRGVIATEIQPCLLIWLSQSTISRFAEHAPDVWSWRGGVFDFPSCNDAAPPLTPAQWSPAIDGRTQIEKGRRVAELRALLSQSPADEMRVVILDELAGILFSIGELDEALRIRREEQMPVCERLGNVRERANTLGKIADVLQARGQFDEALRIRREEELPVYERLGDVRARAITLDKIADVLQAQGELDEALRIRHEELPVYERLGDLRSRAATLGKIADVLQARGQYDEALRIRREEELPVFERLGDVSARARTLGRIADVLQTRGHLDEALRIRREEELPVYERLGDVRERAVTLGKIADVLQDRGNLDEALRIRREEELPVYERLGDVHARAITLGKIADVLQERGDLYEALRIRREEELPVYERLGNVRARAITLGKFADVLQTHGKLDEALSVWRRDVIPTLEHVADHRSLCFSYERIGDAWVANQNNPEAAKYFLRAREELDQTGIVDKARQSRLDAKRAVAIEASNPK